MTLLIDLLILGYSLLILAVLGLTGENAPVLTPEEFKRRERQEERKGVEK
jgi:hypothetical protein